MASNIKAPPGRNMRGAYETRGMSLPLLDFFDAAVKELIHSAKKRGHVHPGASQGSQGAAITPHDDEDTIVDVLAIDPLETRGVVVQLV